MVHLFWVSRSSKWSYYRKAEGVFLFILDFKLKAYLKKKRKKKANPSASELNLYTEADKLRFTYLLLINILYPRKTILQTSEGRFYERGVEEMMNALKETSYLR